MELATTIQNLYKEASELFATVPDTINDFCLAFLILVILDFFTGLGVAKVAHSVSSRTMRTKLFAKMVQYVALMGVAFVIRLMSHSWVPIYTVISGLCAIELTSIIENVCRLQQFGRNLGPLSGFFDRIRPYLAIADKPIVLETEKKVRALPPPLPHPEEIPPPEELQALPEVRKIPPRGRVLVPPKEEEAAEEEFIPPSMDDDMGEVPEEETVTEDAPPPEEAEKVEMEPAFKPLDRAGEDWGMDVAPPDGYDPFASWKQRQKGGVKDDTLKEGD